MEARVEAYLDAICANLPPETPSEAVRDMRREMRGHLQAALAAGQELGETSEQALEHALAQFGKPQMVARQWQEEWETTLAETKAISFLPSLKMALKVWLAVEIPMLAAVIGLVLINLFARDAALRLLLLNVGFFVPPLVAGTVIGRKARRYPVRATLAGYALLLPLLIVGLAAISAGHAAYLHWLTAKYYNFYSQPFSYHLNEGMLEALSFAPLWMILSALSSGAVSLARRYKTRRHQIAR